MSGQTMAERIAELMKLRKVGPRSLQRTHGLNSGQVSNLKNGKRGARISDEQLLKMADALGTTVEYLRAGIGPRDRPAGPPNTPDPTDEFPERANAICRMRGLVGEAAIAEVRAYRGTRDMSEQRWCRLLIEADERLPLLGPGPEITPARYQLPEASAPDRPSTTRRRGH